MKSSTGRILTTHVGSLPRPDDMFAKFIAGVTPSSRICFR